MKFAKDKFSGNKIEATPKAHGVCFCCETELIAKCGEIRLHHWAHKNLQVCDHWWENETEWHRKWKDRFPFEWQEVVKHDTESGEKHIADVYNPIKDLVVEFQNSRIKGTEIQAREKYYKRMLWVLNGNELQFVIIPVEELNYDFAKLKARVRAKYVASYRAEKGKVADQIKAFQKQSDANDDKLQYKKISDREWLQHSKRIDMEISELKEGLEKKKAVIDEMVEKELEIEKYVLKNSKRAPEHRFVFFDWKYKNPNWNAATSPIFVDCNNQLFLLRSKLMALTVPLESFVGKYGNSSD